MRAFENMTSYYCTSYDGSAAASAESRYHTRMMGTIAMVSFLLMALSHGGSVLISLLLLASVVLISGN